MPKEACPERSEGNVDCFRKRGYAAIEHAGPMKAHGQESVDRGYHLFLNFQGSVTSLPRNSAAFSLNQPSAHRGLRIRHALALIPKWFS